MERSYKIRSLFLPILLLAFLVHAQGGRAQEGWHLELAADRPSVTTNEIVFITATLTDGSGEPVIGQEITFTADAGSLVPPSSVTNDQGKTEVSFFAPDETCQCTITASAGEMSGTVVVEVRYSIFRIITVILFFLFGGGAATAAVLYIRRRRAARLKAS